MTLLQEHEANMLLETVHLNNAPRAYSRLLIQTVSYGLGTAGPGPYNPRPAGPGS